MQFESVPIDFVNANPFQPIPQSASMGVAAPTGANGTTLTSAYMSVTKWRECQPIIVIAGDSTFAGSLAIQSSSATAPFFDSSDFIPTNFGTPPDASYTLSISGNGTFLFDRVDLTCNWIRFVLTPSAGTGSGTIQGVVKFQAPT